MDPRRQIVEILQHTGVPIDAVYLFGSRARGDARAGSDWDIAILPERPLRPEERFDLQEVIARALRADVDLVDLRSASAVLSVQVLRDGIVLHESDRAPREAFEAFALSDYARLNEERAAILRDVEARGSVHGG